MLLFIFLSGTSLLAEGLSQVDIRETTVRKTIPLLIDGVGNKGGDLGGYVTSEQGLDCDPRYCLVLEEVKK